MSADGLDEMRALNPTLTDAEAAEVLEEAAALLLTTNRAAYAARALALARRLLRALGDVRGAASDKRGEPALGVAAISLFSLEEFELWWIGARHPRNFLCERALSSADNCPAKGESGRTRREISALPS